MRGPILSAFVLTGAAALIYQLAWIRPLEFVWGSTVYSIAIIFASFMSGLSLGSFLVAKFDRLITHPLKLFVVCELAVGAYGLALLGLFSLLPVFHRAVFPLYENFYLFQLSLLSLTFSILLIPTSLMGATFPLLAKFYVREKIGRGVGELYAANNLGAIVGTLTAGFFLIPLLGIKLTVLVASFLCVAAVCLLIFTQLKDLFREFVPLAVGMFVILGFVSDLDVDQLYSGGFYRSQFAEEVMRAAEFLFHREGLHATVSVVREAEGTLALLINAKGQGSTGVSDLRVNFLLAYLPLLLKPETRDVLVIGLGTGTTSGQLAQFVNVTTVEIEPAVIQAAQHFWFTNLDVMENPRHTLIVDDGRNFLLRAELENGQTYDVIIPEPCDPWQSFSTALYSKEFFELAARRLKAGGLFIQWVPIYELSVADFQSFWRTFNSVFPHVVAFANVRADEPLPVRLATSQLIFVGSQTELDVEGIKAGWERLPDWSRRYLATIHLFSAEDILHLFLFDEEGMRGYGEGAPLITDDRPILEFSTPINLAMGGMGEQVLADLESFLAGG